MKSMQKLGLLNSKEDRVQMSAVLTLSNMGGKQCGLRDFNVVDFLSLQKQVEIELMRRAMLLGYCGYPTSPVKCLDAMRLRAIEGQGHVQSQSEAVRGSQMHAVKAIGQYVALRFSSKAIFAGTGA